MNKRYYLILIPMTLALTTLFFFQNCSSDFNENNYVGASTTTTPTTAPTIQISASPTTLVASANLSVTPWQIGNTTTLTWISSGMTDQDYRCYTNSSFNNRCFTSISCDAATDDLPVNNSLAVGFLPVTAPTEITYTVSCVGLAGTFSDSVTVTWTAPATSADPIITTQPIGQTLSLKTPTVPALSVVVAAPTTDVTYQWFKLNEYGVFTPITGATASTLDLSTSATDVYKLHQHFLKIKGGYQVRVTKGSALTISQSAQIVYAAPTTATLNASCSKTEGTGKAAWVYSGSATKNVNLASGATTYSNIKLSVSRNDHSCSDETPLNARRGYEFPSSGNTLFKCYSDNSGYGVGGFINVKPTRADSTGIQISMDDYSKFLNGVTIHQCEGAWQVK